jgi:hypothetical protein
VGVGGAAPDVQEEFICADRHPVGRQCVVSAV